MSRNIKHTNEQPEEVNALCRKCACNCKQNKSLVIVKCPFFCSTGGKTKVAVYNEN